MGPSIGNHPGQVGVGNVAFAIGGHFLPADPLDPLAGAMNVSSLRFW